MDITVVIPSIPARTVFLQRAFYSALNQTLKPDAISVAFDLAARGAASTRQEALNRANSKWVAFLDDDDEFLPEHLGTLYDTAMSTQADYVYSWFTDTRPDPIGTFGKPFDPKNPTQTTITTLVRTDLAKEIGFKDSEEGKTINGERWGEDFQFTLDCVAAGAKIVHVPARTWVWHWHGGNTNGRPWKEVEYSGT